LPQNNERRNERNKWKRIQKEKKRIAKQCKHCEKLLEKAYCKYNNFSDFEFCIGGKIPYIKIDFIDSRSNEFVNIMIID
jgi:hypothetical protein